MKRNIETFIGCEHEYESADIVLFGAPYDGTTSNRPGARFAGKAIRAESFGIETYSPYLDRDLEDIKVFDGGELELSFGDPIPVMDEIFFTIQKIINDNKIPVMLGGEHLVTYPAVNAAFRKHSDLHIIHFDAHADLRESYMGEMHSHACVMRNCHKIVGDNKIYQFGIRSGDREEFIWAEKHVFLQKFNLNGLDKAIENLKNKPVYFTIDIDILDCGIFPATGTPEAGGISFTELLEGIYKVCELNIIGCDLVEYSPPYDQNGICAATACKLLRELLLSLQVKK